MKKQPITMPPATRYMSEAKDYILNLLPHEGKYILDKTLTGCGGTELFLTSSRPLVLVSPRNGMLANKYYQHPECHLFRDTPDTSLQDLKKKLKDYLDFHPVGLGFTYGTPIILTTLDSAKYVIEELEYRNEIDKYIFLVDEFQCVINDAAFKGRTDLEFLKLLDRKARNICYMSATPIADKYLDILPEFKDLTYYELNWDPGVVVEPTIKEIMMNKGEAPLSIVSGIIDQYRKNGYFAKKIVDGQEVFSTEVVVFINEVKTILSIIKKKKLTPNDATILISNSSNAVKELKSMGFSTAQPKTDRNNPVNRTFTFCSKASFEGCDFYSTNAFTYIFLDATKDWQTHDPSIDIPQILGRQRLDGNPFRYNAIIYYRTKPTIKSEAEFFAGISEKMENSDAIINVYDSGDAKLKKALAENVEGKDPRNPYGSNYLDVVHDTSGYRIEINYLVVAAEHNLWLNKTFLYNNPFHLTTAIQTQLSAAGTKPTELRAFESLFYAEEDNQKKLQLYTEFRSRYPLYTEALYQNPFIDIWYHLAYDRFGPDMLKKENWDMNAVNLNVQTDSIKKQCQSVFITGRTYQAVEVKRMLQRIYNNVGDTSTAKANQLADYITVATQNKTMPDGSRQKVYVIC